MEPHGGTKPTTAPPGRQVRVVAACLAVALMAAVMAPSGSRADATQRIATDAALAARIDAAAHIAVNETHAAGMSIAVAHGGEVVFAAGYGLADLDSRAPADAATIYQIGSISKQFTAAAIVRLAEQGLLDLDAPVVGLVPLPPGNPAPTAAQLLSHTSGIVDASLGPALMQTSDGAGMSAQEALDLVLAPGYGYRPGTSHEYANGNYLLSYDIVEKVSDEGYAEFITDSVLTRAPLTATSMCPAQPPDGWATGYLWLEGTWQRAARLGRPLPLVEAHQANMDLIKSVCSTAPDLVRWAYALRTGGVVTQAHYALMASPTKLTDGTEVPYGLGLQLRRFGDRHAVAHGGIVGGFVSMLADFPDDDVTVALLVNTLLPEHEAALVFETLLAAVFDVPPGQKWTADDGTTSLEGGTG